MLVKRRFHGFRILSIWRTSFKIGSVFVLESKGSLMAVLLVGVHGYVGRDGRDVDV